MRVAIVPGLCSNKVVSCSRIMRLLLFKGKISFISTKNDLNQIRDRESVIIHLVDAVEFIHKSEFFFYT